MLNDFLKARGPTAFSTFPVDKINAMAKACRDAGIEVHLTSWIMPHDLFMDGALAVLPGLIASTGATLLMWDAEGPWCDATGCFDYAAAAAKAERVFPRLGLSGIGAALTELVELAKVCVVWSPQSYATEESQSSPDKVVTYSLGEWRERYGEPVEGWIMGLAGYKQADDAVSTMQPCIDDVVAAGIKRVCYWTINSVMEDDDVIEFLACLATSHPVLPPVPRRTGGIFHVVSVATLTKGTVDQHLKEIQGLLLAWGFGPDGLVDDEGFPDGLPGPKTLDAVKAFQREMALPETGVVDGNTWVAMLGE
jgi:hypothetical protein